MTKPTKVKTPHNYRNEDVEALHEAATGSRCGAAQPGTRHVRRG
jgi:hypothetical protein